MRNEYPLELTLVREARVFIYLKSSLQKTISYGEAVAQWENRALLT